MKLMPSSLAARTVLLVIAVIAVAEFATFSFIFRDRSDAHFRQTVRIIVGQIQLLQKVLPGLDTPTRLRLEEADIGEPGMQLHPDSASVPRREAEFGFARHLLAKLKLTLGDSVLLRHVGPGKGSGLWIGFMVDNERWWLVLPPPRFAPQGLPPDLWWWLSTTLALLVLIAGFFVRGIVGPLARLGEAVTATGAGSASTVAPEGPSEVRRLAEQHNTMVEQLAKAEAERREMLAGLTHDLRTPLARLRVRLALLDNDSDRAGLTRDTDDMERIVSQCLAFLRSEDLDNRVVPPLLIADAVSDMVARQRELGRPVAMTVSPAAANAQVAILPENLQRVLDNLIDNAMQYGAPPVEINLEIEHAGTLTLRVRDHGTGIPAEQRAHALEAFAQIAPERSTRGSCGLGLAIVRRIITGCGGKLSLSDAPEGGLIVSLNIPTISVPD